MYLFVAEVHFSVIGLVVAVIRGVVHLLRWDFKPSYHQNMMKATHVGWKSYSVRSENHKTDHSNLTSSSSLHTYL